MCLCATKSINITEPITVYVIRKTNIKTNCICSPYYSRTKWIIGEIKNIPNIKYKKGVKSASKLKNGFFHSISNIEDANIMLSYCIRCNSKRFHYYLYEAEINPSMIHIGVFNFTYNVYLDSIASTNLTLIKKMGE